MTTKRPTTNYCKAHGIVVRKTIDDGPTAHRASPSDAVTCPRAGLIAAVEAELDTKDREREAIVEMLERVTTMLSTSTNAKCRDERCYDETCPKRALVTAARSLLARMSS
jgi:hypothetical protein